jgi:C1A family cysteine protease
MNTADLAMIPLPLTQDDKWVPPPVPDPDQHPEQYHPFDYEHYVPGGVRIVDWRKVGVVGPIKNQHVNASSCGCCWAFATTAAIETALALSKGEPAKSLSEQQLIACDYHNGSETENLGCSGGSWWLGMDYVIKNNGISTEEEYPYLAHDSKCEEEKERDSQTGENTISGYQFIDSYNETALIATVAHQPALAELCVGDDFVQYWSAYRKGVYNIEGCMQPIDHGVLVVGFNLDDYSGRGAWIIKNSWGAEWGEKGFMRAAMGLGREAAPGKRHGIMNLHHRPAFPRLTSGKVPLTKLSRSSLRSQSGSSLQ